MLTRHRSPPPENRRRYSQVNRTDHPMTHALRQTFGANACGLFHKVTAPEPAFSVKSELKKVKNAGDVPSATHF
jgi:hypothetical protein